MWSCSLELPAGSRSRLIFVIILFLQPSQNWTVYQGMALLKNGRTQITFLTYLLTYLLYFGERQRVSVDVCCVRWTSRQRVVFIEIEDGCQVDYIFLPILRRDVITGAAVSASSLLRLELELKLKLKLYSLACFRYCLYYAYKPSRRSDPWRLVCDVTAAAKDRRQCSFCHAAAAVTSQKCDVTHSVTDVTVLFCNILFCNVWWIDDLLL